MSEPKKTNYIGGALLAVGLFFPTFGATMLAGYVSRKFGKSVGDAARERSIKKEDKSKLHAKNTQLYNLQNVYLRPKDFKKYFGSSKTSVTAYVNNEACVVKRLGDTDSLRRIIHGLTRRAAATGNANFLKYDTIRIAISRDNTIKPEEKAILSNQTHLDHLLLEYNGRGVIRKTTNAAGDDLYYDVMNGDKPKWYVVEKDADNKDKIIFLGDPKKKNYSSQEGHKMTIFKPSKYFFKTMTKEEAKKMFGDGKVITRASKGTKAIKDVKNVTKGDRVAVCDRNAHKAHKLYINKQLKAKAGA